MVIWCFDPGETTGVFFSDGYTAQVPYEEFSSFLYSHLETCDVGDKLPELIIVEQTNIYDKRAGMARKNLVPTIEVQGYIVMLAKLYGVPTKYQWNRDKNKVSDDLLEEHGILVRPKTKWRHANDAARHYLYHMNRKVR